MDGGEEVDHCARQHEETGEVVFHTEAVVVEIEADEVEEEGIDVEGDHADGKEDAVPSVDDFAAWIEDLAPPFLLMVVEEGVAGGDRNQPKIVHR